MDKQFKDEYIRKMHLVLQKRSEIETIVDQVMQEKRANVFLVGIGGTLAIMLPFMHMFKKMSDSESLCRKCSRADFNRQPQSW